MPDIKSKSKNHDNFPFLDEFKDNCLEILIQRSLEKPNFDLVDIILKRKEEYTFQSK